MYLAGYQICQLFNDNPTFNDDISNWDTSNVEIMYRLFAGASAFNRSISSWDVSNVTMMAMFDALVNGAWVASAFNQDIGIGTPHQSQKI